MPCSVLLLIFSLAKPCQWQHINELLLILNPSWYIHEVLCTLLVTSLDLCYIKSLYSPTLHEIDLALVIVIHNLHFTCLWSFASGTGMRHICFAGVSQSANVHKIRSFKARLQQSFAP